MNTFEIFTAEFSFIAQANSMLEALNYFYTVFPNTEVRCIVDQVYQSDYLF